MRASFGFDNNFALRSSYALEMIRDESQWHEKSRPLLADVKKAIRDAEVAVCGMKTEDVVAENGAAAETETATEDDDVVPLTQVPPKQKHLLDMLAIVVLQSKMQKLFRDHTVPLDCVLRMVGFDLQQTGWVYADEEEGAETAGARTCFRGEMRYTKRVCFFFALI